MYNVRCWDSIYDEPALTIGGPAVARELTVHGLMGWRSLQATLASLAPANQSLHALSLTNCWLQPPLHACPGLSSVTELSLEQCNPPAGAQLDDNAALAALLQQMPQLERLTVRSCLQHGDPFPGCLANLSGPTFLSLADNCLDDLPEGTAWAGGCTPLLEQGRESWPLVWPMSAFERLELLPTLLLSSTAICRPEEPGPQQEPLLPAASGAFYCHPAHQPECPGGCAVQVC